MDTTWLIVNLADGQILGELPDLDCRSVSVVIGGYTTTTATIPLPGLPRLAQSLERCTRPGAVAAVMLWDDTPVWGGMVTRRPRTLGETMTLSLATMEAYLDRRYVLDKTYTNTSQTAIVADLATTYLTGLPVRVDATTSARTQTRQYADADDVTMLSALTELSGVEHGPEWAMGWEWSAGHTRMTPVLRVADRLGRAATAGLAPVAVFDAPGCLIDAEYVDDYGAGKGATQVQAVSTGPTAWRPESTTVFVGSGARPPFEHRFSPGMSITDTTRLQSAAIAAGARMAEGARSLTLTAVVDAIDAPVAPRLGTAWGLGDDIGYDITAPAFDEPLRGTARCIGWDLALGQPMTVTPTLIMEG